MRGHLTTTTKNKVMGKTKWFEDMGTPPPKRRNTKSARSYMPGKPIRQQEDAALLSTLWINFIHRLRRQRAALMFKVGQVIGAVFNLGNLKKALVLGAVSYAAFGNWFESAFVSREEVIRPVSIFTEVRDGAGSNVPLSIEPERKSAPKKFPAPKTEMAPVSADDIADADTRLYVQQYYKIAIDEMKQFGVPASISLAQGLIESRAGNSKLAKQNKNHFGIKCFSKKCGKGHCSNHFDDHHKDFFRVFKSSWESWRAHSVMISSGRYASLKKNGRDYKKWAHGLKRLGYATDRTYAEKLIGIIERYKLNRYDHY